MLVLRITVAWAHNTLSCRSSPPVTYGTVNCGRVPAGYRPRHPIAPTAPRIRRRPVIIGSHSRARGLSFGPQTSVLRTCKTAVGWRTRNTSGCGHVRRHFGRYCSLFVSPGTENSVCVCATSCSRIIYDSRVFVCEFVPPVSRTDGFSKSISPDGRRLRLRSSITVPVTQVPYLIYVHILCLLTITINDNITSYNVTVRYALTLNIVLIIIICIFCSQHFCTHTYIYGSDDKQYNITVIYTC